MKLNGVTVKIEREAVIPIIAKGMTLYLIAKPVQSYAEFDRVCPAPVARMGGELGKERPLTEATDYRQKLDDLGKKFSDWVNIASLVEIAGEDTVRFPFEWETVDPEKPETFVNWREELRSQNGFADGDIRRIELEVLRCNQMDDQLIEAAKDHFLAIERERQE